jgi:A/G-specific adenine glycosylase
MLETQNIKAQSFASCLEIWYNDNKRELPWRDNIDPYSVWLSEIILQQTQVKQGWNYYLKIISAFPTVSDLAQVSVDEFYPYWAGLGYYSRARNLLKTAQIVSEKHNNCFPKTKAQLLELPGIGDYTASAIASICFDSNDVAMDGNLNRVFSRISQFGNDLKVQKHKNELKVIAESLAPKFNLGDFNQSLMDLGSSICTTANPKCTICPIAPFCEAQKSGTQTAYPFKSKPLKKEVLYLHYFFLEDGALLVKKRTDGIWNNLFELPGFWLNTKNETVYSNSNLKYETSELTNPVWTTKHLLSHKIMHIHFHRLPSVVNNTFEKLEKGNMATKAFPRPIEKFIHEQYSI